MALLTRPSPAELYELITAGAAYQYMYFSDNSNVWNNNPNAAPANPRAASPPGKPIPEGKQKTSFYETLKFGKATGLLEIFDGFEQHD